MRIVLVVSGLLLLASLLLWNINSTPPAPVSGASLVAPSQMPGDSSEIPAPNSLTDFSTSVYAHNLLLRKGPRFRVYIPWLQGQLARSHAGKNPSFDDPESFFIDVKTGVIHANVGDISNFLNSSAIEKSPLKNIKLSGDGNQIKLSGTLHELIPLQIEMMGTIAVVPGNRIQVHVTKLSVLKIPFKGLLGSFHITVSDLFHPQGISGVEVAGNEIVFDTQKLLPPPHIRGKLTSVRIVNPDLEEIYGDAEHEVKRVEQWRNYLRLSEGTLDFGKLTMHHVDLTMVDISDDAWFDLDLAHYQEQLVNGYTRMTPQGGLQIFMPDLDDIRQKKGKQNTSIEWFKNRNAPPPRDITSK
jgi:hypothetical protein